MKISVYNLYIYEELKKALDMLGVVLKKGSMSESDVRLEFFKTEQARKAYQKGIEKYYDDLEDLIEDDFPEKAEFDEITQGDLEDIPRVLTPKEMQIEFEGTERYINDNKDVFQNTEFLKSSEIGASVESKILDRSEEQKTGLEVEYEKYINSSLFQNASNAAEEFESKISQNVTEFKNTFYQAINANDEVKVIGMLMNIFQTGVKKFFTDDKRYEDFLNNFLSKKDPKELEAFKQDKVNEKYVILFLRLILEKKLKFDEDKSAMIGESLGSLAIRAGEQEFLDIAYGDEALGKFMWKGL
ncbi:MAG: hypothetical protein ABIA91_00090 [Patescibacteria group bacterium]